ncbi:MAG: hypothetical protein M1839_006513 [Geoglossum umbratile]|nr:MAG: hypothetical protein M1839_006513 [Geoglossum umbratile]
MSLKYAELDADLQQIRLLDLHPGNEQDEIRFTLKHVPLVAPSRVERKRLTTSDLQNTLPPGWVTEETSQYHYRFIFEDANENTTWVHPAPDCDPSLWQELEELPPSGFQPAFEALSYTWGSEQDPETAFVDYKYPSRNSEQAIGQRLTTPIRKNLAAALRALRHTNKSRTLWVDAVCIDQSNGKERGSQVKRMSQLYNLAQRVVVWLGPSTPSTSIAITTLQYLGTQLEVSRNQARYRSPKATEPEFFRASTPLPYDETTWQAINEIMSCSWFERLWIWQEIQLANSRAMVVCGLHEIEWQCLRKAIICLYTKDELPFPELRQRLEVIEPLAFECLGSSVYFLLNISRQRICSEPKDHIYGMLSICGPKLASKIKPDYDRSVGYHEVFKDVFLKYLDQVNRLDLLAGCEETSRNHAGPSWVPDWSRERRTYPLYGFTFASGISRSEARYINPGILQVRGIQAAVIHNVTELTPVDYGDILKTWRDREPANLINRSYPTGETLLDAYCATLRAGYLRERWPIHAGPSQEEWKAQYLSTLSSLANNETPDLGNINNADILWCLKLIRGRAFFETHDGYVGLGPPSAQSGDAICILLGCKAPMLLRPFSTPTQDGFRVVGECYVHGLDDGVALLGPLPPDWRVQLGKIPSGYAAAHTYKNLRTGEAKEDDPRLPPLPEEWEKVNRAREPDDPALFQCFTNERTGEEINSDPRLMADELRRQDLNLQTFSLY